MKNVIYVFTVIILAALQTTILSGVQIFGATADLLLAFTVMIALTNGAVYGGSYGLLCGIVADTLMYGRFGFNSLVFMYIGVLLGLFKEHFFRNNSVVALLCSFLASLVQKLLYFLLVHFIHNNYSFWYNILTRVSLGALLTAVATLIMFLIYSYIIIRYEKKGIKRRYGF